MKLMFRRGEAGKRSGTGRAACQSHTDPDAALCREWKKWSDQPWRKLQKTNFRSPDKTGVRVEVD